MKTKFKLLAFVLIILATVFGAKDAFSQGDGAKGPPFYQKQIDKYEDSTMAGISTIYGDAKEVTKEIYSQSGIIANKVWPSIQRGSDFVWDTVVRQQRVWAFVYLFLWLKGILLLYIGDQILKNNNRNWLQTCLGWTWLIIGVTSFIYSSLHYRDMFTGLFNPDYGAINSIIDYVKQLKQ